MGGEYDIRVNAPLVVDGTKVFLLNHCYRAARHRRDGEGHHRRARCGAVHPRDRIICASEALSSARCATRANRLRWQLSATGVIDPELGPISVFPPRATRSSTSLRTRRSRSRYRRATLGLYPGHRRLTQSWIRRPRRAVASGLQEGQRAELPNGAGSITFDRLRGVGCVPGRARSGKGLALASAIARSPVSCCRSAFVAGGFGRASRPGPTRRLVEVGGLARSKGRGFGDEFVELCRDMGGVEKEDAWSTKPSPS